jgi:hypothetical protein
MAFTAGTVGGLMVGFGIIQVGITPLPRHKFKNNYFHVLFKAKRFFSIGTRQLRFFYCIKTNGNTPRQHASFGISR